MNGQVAELKNVNMVQQANNPLQMISVAVEKGQSVESLQMLMDLQERFEANNARKAFNLAMAEFAKNAPKIVKDSEANYGRGKASYSYVTLANAVNVVLPVLSQFGLSHSWKTRQDSGEITVTCLISHEAGHSEATQLTCPADASGNKNNIQAIGSTVTYLQRYTLFSILGLAAFNDDDALQASENHAEHQKYEKVTESQAADIQSLMEEVLPTGKQKAGWLQFIKRQYGAISNNQIPAEYFDNAIQALENKRNQLQPGEEIEI